MDRTGRVALITSPRLAPAVAVMITDDGGAAEPVLRRQKMDDCLKWCIEGDCGAWMYSHEFDVFRLSFFCPRGSCPRSSPGE